MSGGAQRLGAYLVPTQVGTRCVQYEQEPVPPPDNGPPMPDLPPMPTPPNMLPGGGGRGDDWWAPGSVESVMPSCIEGGTVAVDVPRC